MKYHTLFLSKTRKDFAKLVVCCSRDWRFKGKITLLLQFLKQLIGYTKTGGSSAATKFDIKLHVFLQCTIYTVHVMIQSVH